MAGWAWGASRLNERPGWRGHPFPGEISQRSAHSPQTVAQDDCFPLPMPWAVSFRHPAGLMRDRGCGSPMTRKSTLPSSSSRWPPNSPSPWPWKIALSLDASLQGTPPTIRAWSHPLHGASKRRPPFRRHPARNLSTSVVLRGEQLPRIFKCQWKSSFSRELAWAMPNSLFCILAVAMNMSPKIWQLPNRGCSPGRLWTGGQDGGTASPTDTLGLACQGARPRRDGT